MIKFAYNAGILQLQSPDKNELIGFLNFVLDKNNHPFICADYWIRNKDNVYFCNIIGKKKKYFDYKTLTEYRRTKK